MTSTDANDVDVDLLRLATCGTPLRGDDVGVRECRNSRYDR